ncbi:DNA polymerase eta [Notothenia coriiceps]|uniref:DNA polymerase eta n=1 Tax=Notothenia coriiceps TaxID=8208 RepID=A0A6I9P015_9TELE|nr:PREDICTED: DNA polymerase eta [Notothenia coriiceps]
MVIEYMNNTVKQLKSLFEGMLCDLFCSPLHHVPRTPPLTLLHISASKFSDAPSAGGIAGFLSTDVSSSQSLFPTSQLSTQTPSELKTDSSEKQSSTIHSLFKKAAEKHRLKVTKDEDEEVEDKDSTGILPSSSFIKTADSQLEADNNVPVPSVVSHLKNVSDSSNSGMSSFFHKKRLERDSALTLNTPETELKPGPDNTHASEDTVAAVSDLEAKHSSSQQAPCEELRDETDFDPEANPPPFSVAKEDLMNCERCGQEVSVWEMPEHNDYHFALDLQKSLSSSAPSSSSSSNASLTPHRAQSTRGKTKTRGLSGPQPKRHRSQGGSAGTLDSFFKKT